MKELRDAIAESLIKTVYDCKKEKADAILALPEMQEMLDKAKHDYSRGYAQRYVDMQESGLSEIYAKAEIYDHLVTLIGCVFSPEEIKEWKDKDVIRMVDEQMRLRDQLSAILSGPNGDRRLMVREKAKEHLLYKKGDENIPDIIKDCNGDVVLALCKLCSYGERELTEPCPAIITRPATVEEIRFVLEHPKGWERMATGDYLFDNGAILFMEEKK